MKNVLRRMMFGASNMRLSVCVVPGLSALMNVSLCVCFRPYRVCEIYSAGGPAMSCYVPTTSCISEWCVQTLLNGRIVSDQVYSGLPRLFLVMLLLRRLELLAGILTGVDKNEINFTISCILLFS